MKIELNPNTTGMCFISSWHLTEWEPGPYEVDLNLLTTHEKIQFYKAYQVKKILIDEPEELIKSVQDFISKQKSTASNHLVNKATVANTTTFTSGKINELREKDLKKILRGKLETIQEKLSTLDLDSLQKLKELEITTKNRKTLLASINDLIDSLTRVVTEESTANNIKPVAAVKGGLTVQQYLNSISDIKESEEEELVFKVGSQD
jgi:hypothetical protein